MTTINCDCNGESCHPDSDCPNMATTATSEGPHCAACADGIAPLRQTVSFRREMDEAIVNANKSELLIFIESEMRSCTLAIDMWTKEKSKSGLAETWRARCDQSILLYELRLRNLRIDYNYNAARLAAQSEV